jgi:hypothetical protein
MELDGYNEELKIAFEYQGLQHTEYIPFFHGSIEAFESQKTRDRIKRTLCKKNRVRLMIVPQVPTKLSFEDLNDFIGAWLKKNGIKFSKKKLKSIELDFKEIGPQDPYDRLVAAVSERGGRLLEKGYKGYLEKHKTECLICGDKFKLLPGNFYSRGDFCPSCGIRKRSMASRRLTESQAKVLAKKHDLELVIADKYTGTSARYDWRCIKCKSVFSAPAREVFGFVKGRKARGCPKFGGEGEIRTLETLLTPTRVPVARRQRAEALLRSQNH